MLERITEIIFEQMNLEPNELDITAETELRNDLEIDSLDAVEIIMALEDEFNIEISDDTAELFVTVGDVVEYIISQI